MSIILEEKADGTVALYIDGDLQFDSKDEFIYHECLALPALAIAEARTDQALRCLIIGGGDGLAAREILKSARVASVDLVDFDEKILDLARNQIAKFNNDSLSDQRVQTHVEDARAFVKRALDLGSKYDLIVSDFTSPHDTESAQVHCVEFYTELRQLLTDQGIIAVNTASPSGTPKAYLSIFNSMLAGNLNPRPYRIILPSFCERGYGDDWGFIIGSAKLISKSEVSEQLRLAEPRQELKDLEQVRKMFYLPQSVFEQQSTAFGGRRDSDILVHYLNNPNPVKNIDSTALIDTLSIDLAALEAPTQSDSFLVPQELHQPLTELHNDPESKEQLFEKVFELMPALNRFQTREMLNDFLAAPASFIAPIDLGALISELLARATELPGKFVEELTVLKQKLVDFAGNRERLFELGLNSLAIIAVVVVIGNLMYPDSVYAKGAHDAGHHAAAGHHDGARKDGARRDGARRDGRVGVNGVDVVGGYNYTWNNGYWWLNGKRYRKVDGKYVLVP